MWNPIKAVKDLFVKKVGGPIIDKTLESKLPFIGKFITWFNAEPGRRRGAAAVFGLIASALAGFGYAPLAAAVQAFVPFLDLLVPGASIISLGFALWSVIARFISPSNDVPGVGGDPQ